MAKEVIKLELSVDEVNLVLEALGALPFARVFQLIGRLQEQARAQLAGANGAGPTDGPR